MRGRRQFSRTEIEEIRTILVRIRQGELKVQKRLRRRLRSVYGFYISDFDESRQGFTRNNLDVLVSGGTIEVDS